MANRKRLFISGIPVEASEDEVKKRFEVFGDISSIQKITRSQEDFPTKCFAYLDISLSDANYHKCVSLYSKAKWKGNQLVIQPAKENFLNRLKAERQQKSEGSVKKPSISYDSSAELQVKGKDGKRLMKVDVLKNSKKIKRFSSMENCGSIADLTWDLSPTTNFTANNLSAKKTNVTKTSKDKTAKRKKSNKLRLEALEKSKNNKPSIFEGAQVNSRIVFESEDKKEEDTTPDTTELPEQKQLLPLFGSDSEDNSDVEVSKPKFEGKQGAKLFKLQQKIGWDKRFEIDERFLDNNNTSDEDTPQQSDDELATDDEELRREQQRNLDLIKEMFGDTSSIVVSKTRVMPEVQRYDPCAVGSEVLEKQPPPPAKTKKKKVTINEVVEAPASSTKPSQEIKVSKESFYSVSDSLKDSLQAAEGGHIFNFTTSTPKDKVTTSVASSSKAPNWLLNLQDEEGNETTSESDETTSPTELPACNGHKRTLFFFHASSTELRNRLDSPETQFHRTCTLEELEASWPAMRARLKEQYKRRHRDALRWQRQRKQIK